MLCGICLGENSVSNWAQKDEPSCSFLLIRVDTGTFCRDRAAGLMSAAQCVHRASADLHKLLTVMPDSSFYLISSTELEKAGFQEPRTLI